MKRTASFALTLSGLALITIIAACGGGSPTIVVLPVTVSLSTGATSLMATGTTFLTATVGNDPAAKGVTWTVSCSVGQCGSVSPTTTPSAIPTIYTAPNVPPASDLTVTITATSVASPSKTASASVTVLAITVSVSPPSAVVQVGGTLSISANANNDPSGQGVSWGISPASGAGNLSGQTPGSVRYNAPMIAPASDLTVTVTATSIADPSKSATVTITVPSIAISVTAPVSSVQAGTVVQNIVATVTNDPSDKGVTWSISCSPAPCGNISPNATASGAPVTYTAPPAPPPSDLQVTITATSVADPAVSSSVIITVLAISVSVTPPATSVQFGQTVPNIVATVNNDPAGKGVTWAIQPCGVAQCGSISPSSTASGGAITYTAPTTAPASDLPVTIVATSVSDTSQQGSVTITVLAITVSVAICTDPSCTVTAPTAIIPVNATAQFNATPITVTVNNDTNNQGASWTLTQSSTPCSPGCGTVTPTGTASGTPTIYAAPATVPASPTVTVTASSVTDNTKMATATITLTVGTVKLIPASLNFGTVKVSLHPHVTRTETLTNTGSSTLDITGQTITNAAYSVSGPCQGNVVTSVASGSACAIGVTFHPTVAGHYNANLSIADNDVSSPQLVPLSGLACVILRTCFGGANIRSALANNQLAAVPTPTGSNKVGTRVMDVVDATRPDPYLANGAKRELLVRFWYPTALSQRCKPAQYTSPGVLNYLAQLEKVTPPQIKTNSCQDASITAGTHPVVVFTHGYTGTFTDYTFLFEDLASRGYVVASVDHTFEATVVQFPDGRLAKSVLGSHLGDTLQLDEQSTSLAVAVRLSDLKFVMDEMERLNANSKSPFAGKLDMSRVALAGHSLGGTTALLGIELEPRFRAAIAIDAPTPGPLFSPTQKPILMLLAGRDWDKDACRLWSGLSGPRLALNLKGSEHLTPTDAIWLANGAINTGTAGMKKTVSAMRDYIAAFLDVNLDGKPMDRLLTGPSSDYPDVEVTTTAQSPCGEAQSDVQP